MCEWFTKRNSWKKYKIKETKWLRDRINSIKGNAKIRNISNELTNKDITNFIGKPCFYCNEPNAIGIDRINSNEGYTLSNCVSCCSICNRMKNKYSLNIFLDKIDKIYNKFHKESSTTISKESTLQANGSGSGETLSAA